MGQEIEYKLRAPDADALARAYARVGTAAAAGQEQIIEMDTRYFDTPEGVLRARPAGERPQRAYLQNPRARAQPGRMGAGAHR